MRYFACVRGLMLAGSLAVVCGCQPTVSPQAEDSPAPDGSMVSPTPDASPTPAPESPAAASPTAPTQISATGLGVAELGMTFGELKAAMPEATFTVESPFMVDFDAIAVAQDGEVQFYILYLAGDTFDDTAVLQGLLTENPEYRTAEGIGPGSPIAEAEAVYGNAILAYNTDNESREYVRFAQHPAGNLAFRTGTGPEAGLYPDVDASYHETEDYRPDATIQSAMIICLTEDCTAPE